MRLRELEDILETVPLGGEFPDIINPLRTSMIPNLPTFGQNTAGLPPLVNAATLIKPLQTTQDLVISILLVD